jgi:hypothetical protein
MKTWPEASPCALFPRLHRWVLISVVLSATVLAAQSGSRQASVTAPDSRTAELQVVSPQAQSLMLAGHKFTRVDEYYDLATNIWSVIFVDDPKHPASFADEVILNFYDWTPKPTAETVATVLSEERPGTRNVFLFKSPDESGGALVYHIVSVSQGRANFVNVMSIAGWEKSAVNVDFSHRLRAGSDLKGTEEEARQWLLSTEGEALRNAAAALRLGLGWGEYLRKVR